MATIRDLQVHLTVDTDVASGLTKATLAFRETVREAENAQDRLDRIGHSARDTDRDMDHLGVTFGRFTGVLSRIGLDSLLAAGKLGILTGSILALSGAASSAIVPIVGLVADLTPLIGALAALPGVIATGGAAFGILKVALSGVGDLIKDLWSNNMKKFEKDIADASWGAQALAYTFQQDLLPELKNIRDMVQDAFWFSFSLGLKDVSNALHGMRGSILGVAMALESVLLAFQRAFLDTHNLENINSILEGTSRIIERLATIVEPLAKGFLDLAVVGNTYLIGLTDNVAKLATQFGNWMSDIANSGKALDWIKGAADTAKQLWNVIKDFAGVFGAFGRAAESAGLSTLGVLGKLLEGANQFLNSVQGQKILVAIFTTLSTIGATLVPVFEAIAQGVADIAPGVAELAKLVGPVLTAIAQGLSQAILKALPGLKIFMAAVADGIKYIATFMPFLGIVFGNILKALAPLIPLLAKLVGQLLVTFVNMLEQIYPSLAEFLIALAKLAPVLVNIINSMGTLVFAILAQFLDALIPILPVIGEIAKVLGKIATDVLNHLWVALVPILPVLTKLAKSVGLQLAKALEELAPLLVDLVDQFINLLPAIIPILPELAKLVMQYLPLMVDVLKILLPQSAELIKLFIQVLAAILPLLPRILQMSEAWIPVATQILKIAVAVSDKLLPILDKFLPKVIDIVEKVVGWFQWLFDKLLGHSIIPDIANGMKKWFDKAVGWIFDAVDFLRELPGKIGEWFRKAKDAAVEKFTELIDWVKGLPGSIIAALGDFGHLLYDSGRKLLQGLIDGLWSMVQNVMNTVGDILGKIRDAFPFSPAKWGPFSGRGYTTYSGAAMMKDFAKGIVSQSGLVDKAIGTALTHELTPTLTPNIGGFSLAPNSSLPQFAGIGAMAGAGNVVIQNLTLQFADDRDMYTKGQEFAAGLREYQRLGGVIPTP